MNAKSALIAILVGFVGILLLFFPIAYGCSGEWENGATIERKERINDGESGKYLVFTDKGVYEITDSLIFFRWDSSDLYGKLKEGKKYDFYTAGWRAPLLSMYNNIIEAKLCEGQEEIPKEEVTAAEPSKEKSD